ncbi:MAG: pseudouridine synthase, partial [Bacteroidetes bacterium]|nr:pseudouridine synthase [Bacteroidota bacterium]
GVSISVNKKKYQTKTCKVERLQDGEIWFPERIPAPRIKHGYSWISISLIEGKNRQVRKMTAAVGFPTLRLVRVSIEDLSLAGLLPGQVKSFDRDEVYKLLKLD